MEYTVGIAAPLLIVLMLVFDRVEGPKGSKQQRNEWNDFIILFAMSFSCMVGIFAAINEDFSDARRAGSGLVSVLSVIIGGWAATGLLRRSNKG